MESSDDDSSIGSIIEQNSRPYKTQRGLYEPPHNADDSGPLRTFDVFALIVNKMIGTGIYTAPATVFLMTGNKAVTMGLFGVGFAYSVVSMWIYLNFAKVLPFNGGELIYLDEITSHISEPTQLPTPRSSAERDQGGIEMSDFNHQGQPVLPHPNANTSATKQNTWWAIVKRFMTALPGDGLLAFTIYSIAFIVFFNSGSNSLQFGRMILLCINAKDTTSSSSPGEINEDQNKTSTEVNRDAMRLIGVNVLTLICLLQYFSPSFGRRMNKLLSLVKIGFLIGLIVVAGKHKSASDNWYTTHPTEDELKDNPNIGKPAPVAFAKALLAVLFSFEGWENATFVAGEIPANKHHILRNGFIGAVLMVGAFYLAVVGLFLRAISWEDISDGHENVNYPPMLSQNNIDARRAWPIVAAMSSFGSLNAIIYTFSRVKQAIGQAEIFPWSRYLKKDDKLQRDHNGSTEDDYLYKAPQGGLIAHWVMSVIVISASAGIPNTLEAASLPGYVQTYVHCFFQGVLGFFFWRLGSRKKALWPSDPSQRHRIVKFLRALLVYTIVFIYVVLNGAILVINVVGPYKGTDGSSAAFPGYGFPSMIAGLLVVGTLYYLFFFGDAPLHYEPVGGDDGGDTESLISGTSKSLTERGALKRGWNLMRFANVKCEIRKNYTYDSKLERVYRFGRRWRIIYSVPGDPGYQSSDEQIPDPEGVTWRIFLYWLFGGSRLNPRWNPGHRARERWGAVKRRVNAVTRRIKNFICCR